MFNEQQNHRRGLDQKILKRHSGCHCSLFYGRQVLLVLFSFFVSFLLFMLFVFFVIGQVCVV